MMKLRIVLGLVVAILVSGLKLQAQQLTVRAGLDSTQMLIGQQTKLFFEFTQKKGDVIVAPIFSDTIVQGLEIVEPLKSDTSINNDGVMVVKQSYTVTSFEDTLVYIPPYPFVSGDDTVWSKSLSLKVIQPFQIDTTKQEIADIKDVMSPLFNWKALFKMLLWTLLGLALLTAAWFIWRKFYRPKVKGEVKEKLPDLPPYVIAVQKLDKIKQEKLWQQNRHKEYHTQVTDVIREYIEYTFDVPAMEMTTDEILLHLNHLRFEQKSSWLSLQQLLQLADLVKFAKWNAGPDEHELSLMNAYLFVNQTKVEEAPELKEKQDDIS